MKETLRLILRLKDSDFAVIELDQWIVDASECGLKPIEELAEKIKRHRENILNAITHFGGGSWRQNGIREQAIWLEKNRDLWE